MYFDNRPRASGPYEEQSPEQALEAFLSGPKLASERPSIGRVILWAFFGVLAAVSLVALRSISIGCSEADSSSCSVLIWFILVPIEMTISALSRPWPLLFTAADPNTAVAVGACINAALIGAFAGYIVRAPRRAS